MGQNLSPFSSKSAADQQQSMKLESDKREMGAEISYSGAEDKNADDNMLVESATIGVTAFSKLSVVEQLDKRTLKHVAKYTPLRLTDEERVLLGVVEGALDHSEFTSNVDVSSSMHYVRETYDRDDRVESEVREFCCVLLGLSAANDYKTRGKETLGQRLEDREEFFQACLEIGRRFKILNPGLFIL